VRGNAEGLTKRQLLPAHTVIRSRELRKNAGDPERAVWRMLREAFPDARFRRQVPFGPYHADFCSHAAKLIVEIDDATHALKTEADEARTRFLNREGYRVIRFWNNEVMENPDGVAASIAAAIPSPLVGVRGRPCPRHGLNDAGYCLPRTGGAKRRMRGSCDT
jgi:very-short-patch-repair endonuclease